MCTRKWTAAANMHLEMDSHSKYAEKWTAAANLRTEMVSHSQYAQGNIIIWNSALLGTDHFDIIHALLVIDFHGAALDK